MVTSKKEVMKYASTGLTVEDTEFTLELGTMYFRFDHFNPSKNKPAKSSVNSTEDSLFIANSYSSFTTNNLLQIEGLISLVLCCVENFPVISFGLSQSNKKYSALVTLQMISKNDRSPITTMMKNTVLKGVQQRRLDALSVGSGRIMYKAVWNLKKQKQNMEIPASQTNNPTVQHLIASQKAPHIILKQ